MIGGWTVHRTVSQKKHYKIYLFGSNHFDSLFICLLIYLFYFFAADFARNHFVRGDDPSLRQIKKASNGQYESQPTNCPTPFPQNLNDDDGEDSKMQVTCSTGIPPPQWEGGVGKSFAHSNRKISFVAIFPNKKSS